MQNGQEKSHSEGHPRPNGQEGVGHEGDQSDLPDAVDQAVRRTPRSGGHAGDRRADGQRQSQQAGAHQAGQDAVAQGHDTLTVAEELSFPPDQEEGEGQGVSGVDDGGDGGQSGEDGVQDAQGQGQRGEDAEDRGHRGLLQLAIVPLVQGLQFLVFEAPTTRQHPGKGHLPVGRNSLDRVIHLFDWAPALL